MALMLAGRVLEVREDRAIVDVDGQPREAKLDFIKDVKPGDYVKIYYGIVLEKVSEKEARETLEHCSYHRGTEVEMTFSLTGLKTRGLERRNRGALVVLDGEKNVSRDHREGA